MRYLITLAAVLTSVVANPSPQASDNGGLPVGAECNPSAFQNECANGASCYATNSGLIPRCGNFQASCTSDAQCAYNTCNNGFCNGFIPSGTPSGRPSLEPTPPVFTNSSTTTTSETSTTPPAPTITDNTSVRYVNSTTFLSPSTAYTTSIVIVDGRTSSVLVNPAGSTTPFGAEPTLVDGNGAAGLHVGMGLSGVLAVAVGFANLL